jgi:hypothetical protein
MAGGQQAGIAETMSSSRRSLLESQPFLLPLFLPACNDAICPSLFPGSVFFFRQLFVSLSAEIEENLNVTTGRKAYLSSGELSETEPQICSLRAYTQATQLNNATMYHRSTAKHMAFAHTSEFTNLQASCKS